jgi:hypothetical protein
MIQDNVYEIMSTAHLPRHQHVIPLNCGMLVSSDSRATNMGTILQRGGEAEERTVVRLHCN